MGNLGVPFEKHRNRLPLSKRTFSGSFLSRIVLFFLPTSSQGSYMEDLQDADRQDQAFPFSLIAFYRVGESKLWTPARKRGRL